jgi:hypothetical protein
VWKKERRKGRGDGGVWERKEGRRRGKGKYEGGKCEGGSVRGFLG